MNSFVSQSHLIYLYFKPSLFVVHYKIFSIFKVTFFTSDRNKMYLLNIKQGYSIIVINKSNQDNIC